MNARREQLRAYSRFAALAWDREHDSAGDLGDLLERLPAIEKADLLDLCLEIIERNTLQASPDLRELDWAAQRDPDYVISFAVRLRAAAYGSG